MLSGKELESFFLVMGSSFKALVKWKIVICLDKNMNSVVINIKTDPKVKKEAKKIASDLGLTLSGTINGFLKQLIRNKSIFFTLDESNPSHYLLSSIEEAKKERRNKKHHTFKSNEEALKFLDK